MAIKQLVDCSLLGLMGDDSRYPVEFTQTVVAVAEPGFVGSRRDVADEKGAKGRLEVAFHRQN